MILYSTFGAYLLGGGAPLRSTVWKRQKKNSGKVAEIAVNFDSTGGIASSGPGNTDCELCFCNPDVTCFYADGSRGAGWAENYWLVGLNYLHVAKAALTCSAYLSALLYSELWWAEQCLHSSYSQQQVVRLQEGYSPTFSINLSDSTEVT
jgi:hypothetical protein